MRARGAADGHPLAFQPIRQGMDRGDSFRVRGLARLVCPYRHAQFFQAGKARCRQVHRQAGFIRVGTGQNIQRNRQIGGGAAHRADDRDIRAGRRTGRRIAVIRQQPIGRLVAEYAAEMRRHADRPADIAADLEPGQSGGKRRGRSAGRSARRVGGVPRVGGGAVNRIIALPVGQIDRNVGLAEDHRPGGFQPADRDRRYRDRVGLHLHMATGGRQSLDVEALFHRGRNAEQRRCLVCLRIEASRPRSGPVEVADDDGVDRRIMLFRASDIMVEQFQCADFTRAGQAPPVAWRTGMSGPCCGPFVLRAASHR